MASSFQRIHSSDESDLSDGENDVNSPQLTANAPDLADVVVEVGGETIGPIKASQKLEIVGNRKNLNKKFSIWSEILMEEELNESMNSALKVNTSRRRKKKPQKGEKDSDNYSFWTKQDFDRKFAVKKTCELKKKIKSKQLKKDIVTEISRKLSENRVDIIRKIVSVLGEERTHKLAAEVQDIESAGGMMTAVGNRRRSPGGVLFYLVKNDSTIPSDQKRDIFCDDIVKQGDKLAKEMKKSKIQGSAKASGKKKKKSKKKKKKKGNNTE